MDPKLVEEEEETMSNMITFEILNRQMMFFQIKFLAFLLVIFVRDYAFIHFVK